MVRYFPPLNIANGAYTNSFPWVSSFEFCFDSGIIRSYGSPKNYFSVVSVEEASAWVKIIEFVSIRSSSDIRH